ncbi:hypothetical protein SAMN05216188_12533 [Lentzea xinjiangensis]|uniref:Uncharacterized protein n=2 Tax=Lentzea xinjiangensis TaxID=402600 RepID=A0A1H9V8Z2_9PSEU|nr:hypothetical protein SAMN05216188_12533 [Lentzea xinjiangensis]
MDRIEREVLGTASRERVRAAPASAGHGTGRAIIEEAEPGFTRLGLPPGEQERHASGDAAGRACEPDELREYLEK